MFWGKTTGLAEKAETGGKRGSGHRFSLLFGKQCGPACGWLLKLANKEDRGQKTELGSEIKMTVPSLFLSVLECLRYTVK